MRIKAQETISPEIQNEEASFHEEEAPVLTEEAPGAEADPPKKKLETSKLIVFLCLLNGILWVWCSYILAWMDKVQIAESLSQVAVTEIIGVVLVYCLKSLFENLSKNNHWPDKTPKDPKDPPGVG